MFICGDAAFAEFPICPECPDADLEMPHYRGHAAFNIPFGGSGLLIGSWDQLLIYYIGNMDLSLNE